MKGFRTERMQERRESGWRDLKLEGYKKKGCRKRGIQERRDLGLEG